MFSTTKSERRQRHDRRFVLFIGPQKTATTTLQDFLYTYANQTSDQLTPAFANWSYPALFPKQTNTLKLMAEPENDPLMQQFFSSQGALNIVAGSEYLFAPGVLRNGQAFDLLQNWTGGMQPEIVILVRNPRTSHLISIWKQNYFSHKKLRRVSFRDFLCDPANTAFATNRIGIATNPLKIARQHLYEHQFKTTVMDMKSIADAGTDIVHAFACSVLGVPCTSDGHWILGLENVTLHSNAKKADPRISVRQMAAMDKAFLQRDCAYYSDLYNHSRFRAIPTNTAGIWPEDCRDISPEYHLDDGELLLKELRRIYHCPSVEEENDEDEGKTILLPSEPLVLEDTTATLEPSTSQVDMLQANKSMVKGEWTKQPLANHWMKNGSSLTKRDSWIGVLGTLVFVVLFFCRIRWRS